MADFVLADRVGFSDSGAMSCVVYNGKAYVTVGTYPLSSIYTIDLTTFVVEETVHTSTDAANDFNKNMVVDTSAGYAYTATVGGVTRINLSDFTITDLPLYAGSRPCIQIDQPNGLLYAVGGQTANYVKKIDLTTFTVSATYFAGYYASATGGQVPVITGGYLYYIDNDSGVNKIIKVDVPGMTTTATLSISTYAGCLATDGTYLYYAHTGVGGDNTTYIERVQLSDFTAYGSPLSYSIAPQLDYPTGFVMDTTNHKLFVGTNQGNVYVIDTTTFTFSQTAIARGEDDSSQMAGAVVSGVVYFANYGQSSPAYLLKYQDSATLDGIYYRTLIENLIPFDGIKADAALTIAESLNLSEAMICNIGKLVRDYLFLKAVLQSAAHNSVELADAFSIWGDPKTAKGFLKLLEETATLGDLVDLPALAKALVLREFLHLTPEITTGYHGTVTTADQFKVQDRLTQVKGFLKALTDGLTTTDAAMAPMMVLAILLAEESSVTDATTQGLGAVLKEILFNQEALSSTWRGTVSVLEALRADEKFAVGLGTLIRDSVSMADNGLYLFALACLASDTLTTSEGITAGKVASATCKSSLTITATLQNAGVFSDILKEYISLSFSVMLDGELYQCWSFTTDSMFPALYTNFQFNSFATVPDGRVFGCKSDGIYLLEGEDDAGTKIETGVRLNFFNFGTHRLKSLYYASFGLVGENPALKVITKEGAHKYFVLHGYAGLPQGVKSQTWELVLADIDALDFVEITPIILAR